MPHHAAQPGVDDEQGEETRHRGFEIVRINCENAQVRAAARQLTGEDLAVDEGLDSHDDIEMVRQPSKRTVRLSTRTDHILLQLPGGRSGDGKNTS